MKWHSIGIALLAGLAVLFFAAFGYLSLIEYWKAAIVSLVFALCSGFTAFMWASIVNVDPS